MLRFQSLRGRRARQDGDRESDLVRDAGLKFVTRESFRSHQPECMLGEEGKVHQLGGL